MRFDSGINPGALVGYALLGVVAVWVFSLIFNPQGEPTTCQQTAAQIGVDFDTVGTLRPYVETDQALRAEYFRAALGGRELIAERVGMGCKADLAVCDDVFKYMIGGPGTDDHAGEVAIRQCAPLLDRRVDIWTLDNELVPAQPTAAGGGL